LPGFEAVSWFAMFAPANTPKTIVTKLQVEIAKILKSPDISTRRLDSGRIGGIPAQRDHQMGQGGQGFRRQARMRMGRCMNNGKDNEKDSRT